MDELFRLKADQERLLRETATGQRRSRHYQPRSTRLLPDLIQRNQQKADEAAKAAEKAATHGDLLRKMIQAREAELAAERIAQATQEAREEQERQQLTRTAQNIQPLEQSLLQPRAGQEQHDS